MRGACFPPNIRVRIKGQKINPASIRAEGVLPLRLRVLQEPCPQASLAEEKLLSAHTAQLGRVLQDWLTFWNQLLSTDLLTFSPDCPASCAEGFGISEQCSQQKDVIAFPWSFPPSYSPVSELWGTFYWSHGFVSLTFGIMGVQTNHIQWIKLTTSGWPREEKFCSADAHVIILNKIFFKEWRQS